MYKSASRNVNKGNGIRRKSNWSYDEETAKKINTSQKLKKEHTELKCEIDPNHTVEEQHGEWGPHKCRIVCVECGERFIQWGKINNKIKIKSEDYYIKKTEEYIKYMMDEDVTDAKKSLDDILGI
tara:strand:- start:70 stop:444 length:375 start_codon:yes stop_codon:yes gene_type:complete